MEKTLDVFSSTFVRKIKLKTLMTCSMEISLLFLKYFSIPDLYTGMIYTHFHSVGKTPVLTERYMTRVIGADITGAKSFNNPGQRSSIPVVPFDRLSTSEIVTRQNFNVCLFIRNQSTERLFLLKL